VVYYIIINNMDKAQLLSAFNDHFMQFIQDIQLVFPDNSDVAAAIIAIGKLRKANPRLLIMSFKEHVVSGYRKEIEKGDIDFFINNDYQNDFNSMGKGSSNKILEKIDCLRGPVRDMNKSEQDKVIKYLQNLLKLSDMFL
jgi:hypothetical protein